MHTFLHSGFFCYSTQSVSLTGIGCRELSLRQKKRTQRHRDQKYRHTDARHYDPQRHVIMIRRWTPMSADLSHAERRVQSAGGGVIFP